MKDRSISQLSTSAIKRRARRFARAMDVHSALSLLGASLPSEAFGRAIAIELGRGVIVALVGKLYPGAETEHWPYLGASLRECWGAYADELEYREGYTAGVARDRDREDFHADG